MTPSAEKSSADPDSDFSHVFDRVLMPKVRHEHHLRLDVTGLDRNATRTKVVQTWLAEEPGTLESTQYYRYDVETLADGSIVYLSRPTRLNKGMDFVIYCENFVRFKNGKCKPPKHRDLFAAIETSIKSGGSTAKQEWDKALTDVWLCREPGEVLRETRLLHDTAAERALKIAKWFFIEQDLTYWTESGRWMLRAALAREFGLAKLSP